MGNNSKNSIPLTTNASGKLDVLWHDGDPLGMNGAEICVFEQSHHVCLTCFLDCEYSLRLESQVTLVFSGDFTHQALEWQFANQ